MKRSRQSAGAEKAPPVIPESMKRGKSDQEERLFIYNDEKSQMYMNCFPRSILWEEDAFIYNEGKSRMYMNCFPRLKLREEDTFIYNGEKSRMYMNFSRTRQRSKMAHSYTAEEKAKCI